MTDATLRKAAGALSRLLSSDFTLKQIQSVQDQKTDGIRDSIAEQYAQELEGLPADSHPRWLLDRIASIEARLMVLSAAIVAAKIPIPRIASVLDPIAGPVSPTQLQQIALDGSFPLFGFLDIEQGKDGFFRWIGPEPRAKIVIPKIRSSVNIKLEVNGTMSRDSLEKVKIRVDDGDWLAAKVLPGRAMCDLHFSCPIYSDTSILTSVIEIDSVASKSPSMFGEDDERLLSLALLGIVISAA